MSLDNIVNEFKTISFTQDEENILRQYRNKDSFINYTKKKIIANANIYSISLEDSKNLIIKYPRFATINQIKKLEKLTRVYGIDNLDIIMSAVIKFPQFITINHDRFIKKSIQIYGKKNEEKIKQKTLLNPKTVSINHSNAIKKITDIYGTKYERKIKDAILRFPPFVSLNHDRVLRQKTKIGKLINLEQEDVIEILLKYPSAAGFSYHRDFAVLQVKKELQTQEIEIKLKSILNIINRSPYVPNTKKLNIKQARTKGVLYEMPKMYEMLYPK